MFARFEASPEDSALVGRYAAAQAAVPPFFADRAGARAVWIEGYMAGLEAKERA